MLADPTDTRVTAPVLGGEALEHDPDVGARERHGDQTEQGNYSHLASTELADLVQDVVERGHDHGKVPEDLKAPAGLGQYIQSLADQKSRERAEL